MASRLLVMVILTIGLLAAPLAAEAQHSAKGPHIGVLVDLSLSSPNVEAFRQGLRELGYVDGQNLIIEYRSGEGKEERLAKLAAELVQLKVAVIAALDPPAAEAAKNSTRTIPIVMRATSDPVEAGLVASLARPGGNITGLYSIAEELIGKRLELLKEVHPEITRVAVLWNPDWPRATRWFKETESAARALGLQLQSLEVRSAKDFETAFQAASRGRAGA
jgi:putative ABC transport system substrate-binding protein